MTSDDVCEGLTQGTDKRCSMYRCFDAEGVLLYVGISLSTIKRLGQHRLNTQWFQSINRVDIEHFDSRRLAADAEIAAIQAERPRHNIKGNVYPLDIKGNVYPLDIKGNVYPLGCTSVESDEITGDNTNPELYCAKCEAVRAQARDRVRRYRTRIQIDTDLERADSRRTYMRELMRRHRAAKAVKDGGS